MCPSRLSRSTQVDMDIDAFVRAARVHAPPATGEQMYACLYSKVCTRQAGTVSAHSGAHARRPHTMVHSEKAFLSGPCIVCGLAGGGLGAVLSVHLARPPAPRFRDRGRADKSSLSSPYK